MGQVELDHRDVQCTLQVRNTMIDQIVLDKENVPPQPTSNTRQRCQVINRVPSTIKRGKWIEQTLEEAMETIEKETHFLKKVSRS